MIFAMLLVRLIGLKSDKLLAIGDLGIRTIFVELNRLKCWPFGCRKIGMQA